MDEPFWFAFSQHPSSSGAAREKRHSALRPPHPGGRSRAQTRSTRHNDRIFFGSFFLGAAKDPNPNPKTGQRHETYTNTDFLNWLYLDYHLDLGTACRAARTYPYSVFPSDSSSHPSRISICKHRRDV